MSIIIVNWNVQQHLASCLESIDLNLRQTPWLKAEVIVVDNASTDGSVAMLRTQYPWVTLLTNTVNNGFAAANNQGIRVSRGENILLLNPDTELHNHALATLLNYLAVHPEVGAVGPLLENPDGTLQLSCYPTPSLRYEALRLMRPNRDYGSGAYPMHTWSQHEARTVDVLQGACLLIRGHLLAQVGLLDEAFFIYTEEVDLCTRIRRAGWQIVWAPQARVIHYGGQSTRQIAPQMFLQLYASKIIYFRKHHGLFTAWLYKLILVMASLLRLAATIPARLLAPAKRQHYLRIAENYRQLLVALPTI